MDDIIKKRDEALKGRELWIRIEEEYQFSNDDVLVIVSEPDDEIGKEVLRQLDTYLIKKYLKRAIVIVQDINSSIKDSNIFYHIESKENIKCIEQYYRLTQFTKNIIVASGKQPFGGCGIVGKNNISVVDYVTEAILV